VNPGLRANIQIAEPDASVHGEVAYQFENRQGHEGDSGGEVLGQGFTGQTGAAVNEHGAGTADCRPADKIKHEGGVLFFPDTIQEDEQTHVGSLINLELLHVGRNIRGGRIVAEKIQN
jgi:hypothetical protein